MDKFASYLRKLDITQNVTEEEVEKTEMLRHAYAPTLRSAAHRLEELGEECYEGRRQTISDFINLAIDYDRDADRKRIAERLSDMGHSMELLSILESALLLMKEDPRHGDLYYKLLSTRYFDAYCRSNEDAFLALGMSSSSYYRHIKRAVRMYAAYLWCVVIPDLILKEDLRKEYNGDAAGHGGGSQVGDKVAVNWY